MGVYFQALIATLAIAGTSIVILDKFIFARLRPLDAKAPKLAEYAYELWWVFLVVFILRSFVFGIVTVPTGSMLPTIQLNDYVFVNKLAYGIRSPFSGRIWLNIGSLKRGDIIVFRYPVNPEVEFIKTVVGLPGDHITYINKQLFINGEAVAQHKMNSVIEPSDSATQAVDMYTANIDGKIHTIFIAPWMAAVNFKDLVVPQGQYFVMGDNRDFSADSRYWGFVPDKAIEGKATSVLFSWDSAKLTVRWSRMLQSLN